MKVFGHPSALGWTTLQTVRSPDRVDMMSAQYKDGKLWLASWMYDRTIDNGEWLLMREIEIEHHAMVTMNAVYANGMRAEIERWTKEEGRSS